MLMVMIMILNATKMLLLIPLLMIVIVNPYFMNKSYSVWNSHSKVVYALTVDLKQEDF